MQWKISSQDNKDDPGEKNDILWRNLLLRNFFLERQQDIDDFMPYKGNNRPRYTSLYCGGRNYFQEYLCARQIKGVEINQEREEGNTFVYCDRAAI